MQALRRQFSIDDHLGRFQKALRHLCDLHAFEEVKPYTIKHNLYAEALDFYRYQDDKLMEIMKIYADHLQSSGNFRDAGIGMKGSRFLYQLLLTHHSLRVPPRLRLSKRILPSSSSLERISLLCILHHLRRLATPHSCPLARRHPHRIKRPFLSRHNPPRLFIRHPHRSSPLL